jgi:ATP-binding cassette, subfamily B, multidrug efflux pump
MKKSPLRFIMSYAKPYCWYLLFAFVCSLAYVACNILIPVFSGWALDYMADGRIEEVYKDIWAIIGLMLGGALCYYGISYLSSLAAYQMVRDMRKEAMDKILYSEISYLDKKGQGDIISTLISDADIISDGLIETFLQFFNGFFTIIGTLAMMYVMSWRLATIVLLLTPLSMVAALFIAKGTAKTFKKQSDLRGKLNALVLEAVEGAKVVKANSFEEESEKSFAADAADLHKLDFWTEFYAALINPTTRMINALIYGSAAAVGAYFIITKESAMTSGALMSFLMFTNNYTQPFNAISEVISDLQNAFASAKRFMDLNSMPLVSDDENKPSLQNVDGSISIQNLSFSYVKSRKLLEDINVDIKPGMHVAVVGPTGCGKTTLISLIMRFYDPDGGSILISNQDIEKVSRYSLRDTFGMVLQDTWIFKGTIKDNIKYGNENATDEEVIEAAKAASADFFIRQMKDGYDTVLAGDESLSEGQKQLICIARVMLKKPKMLILDEATSNVDTRSELLINKGFDEMMKGKTSLIIAHRLSTIVNADMILVMKDGKLIEKGTHDELLKKNGFYSELYQSQFAKA